MRIKGGERGERKKKRNLTLLWLLSQSQHCDTDSILLLRWHINLTILLHIYIYIIHYTYTRYIYITHIFWAIFIHTNIYVIHKCVYQCTFNIFHFKHVVFQCKKLTKCMRIYNRDIRIVSVILRTARIQHEYVILSCNGSQLIGCD